MSGRLESRAKIEKNIQQTLINLPTEVTDYYNAISVSKEPRTCLEYIQRICSLFEFLTDDVNNFKVNGLNEADIAQYMRSITTKTCNGAIRETSFSFQKTAWCAINSFTTYLAKKRIIEVNPMIFIDKPKNNDVVNRVLLTEEDIKTLIKYLNKEVVKSKNYTRRQYIWAVRNRLIFLLLIKTGMRETALTEIDIDDIDMENNTLWIIDKRHKKLVYNLSEQIMARINEWIELRKEVVSEANPTSALFVSCSGARLTRGTVGEIVSKATFKGLGVALSPHKFRSAFCSILYEKTGDIEFVRDAVGHGSSNITQRYIVKKTPAQIKAIKIMDEVCN